MIKLKLKEQMKKQNMSTADLVRETKIHRNTISKLLNGKSNGIQFDTLDLLYKALKCESITDLIDFADE